MTLVYAYECHMISPTAEILCRKSWIAYERALALPVIMLLVAYPAVLLNCRDLTMRRRFKGGEGLYIEGMRNGHKTAERINAVADPVHRSGSSAILK